MNSTRSCLHPPNRYSLSDVIVGSMMQRTDSGDHRFNYITNLQDAKPKVSMPDVLQLAERAAVVDNTARQKPPTDEKPALQRHKRQRQNPTQANECESRSVRIGSKVLRKRRSRSRVLCRVHEARYRERRHRMEEDLKINIQILKEDIKKLKARRRRIIRDISANKSRCCVVMEYFRLFRYGYVAKQTEIWSCLPPTAQQCSAQGHFQLEFLQATLSVAVTDGIFCGVEALLDNWRFISLHHDDICLSWKCLEQDPNNLLIVTITTSLTITADTLRNVYPHLLINTEDSNEKQSSPLAASLLNQRLVVPGTVLFDWGDGCGRVVRMESKSDMIAPILGLVGSLEGVARVFDGARITPELRMVTACASRH